MNAKLERPSAPAPDTGLVVLPGPAPAPGKMPGPCAGSCPKCHESCWFSRVARVLLVVGAVALLVSPRFPFWTLSLAAPQYPKGLSLSIHPQKVTGDVGEIDGLNHYIGMRKIDDAAPLERRLGVPAVVVMAVCLVIAAAWGSRWGVLLVLPALVFPALFLGDLYWWLRDSGLHLDSHAAFSSSIKPFVPVVLGSGKIAQFRTEATLGLGYYLSLGAAAAALVFSYERLCPVRAWLNRRRAAQAVRVAGLILVMTVTSGRSGAAETIVVAPGGPVATLADALARAAPGDTVVVRGGTHPGPVVVRKSVRLVGEGRPVLDGGGRGTVVRLEAPGCVLRGFTIRSSGNVLEREDGGVLAAAADLRIEENRLEDVLFGIYLKQAPRSVVRGNTLRGKDQPVPRRGDLIRLWYSHDVTIEGNTTVGGRDAVLWYCERLTIRDNDFRGGRYGLHFMYCNDATVIGNRLQDNSVGAFLMYSQHLRLRNNAFVGNRGVSGYGIGLKDMDDCQVAGNVLAANKVGVFLENSRGEVRDNLIAGNDKGMILFPSATGNRFEANSFVENGEQVEIEGFSDTMTSNLWRGNYWSDYRGYDLDGDGRGDLAYRPARLFERLSDRCPALRLFADNPSAQAIDFAAGIFPIFAPKPKFADEQPRMRPLPPPVVLAGPGDPTHWLAVGAVFLLGPLALAFAPSLGGGRMKTSGWLGRNLRRPGAPVLADRGVEDSAPATPTAPARPVPAIDVAGLTKRFGRVLAVDGVSFAVSPGETVALWGPNGAGKTTVIRCLLGLLPCDGAASVLGRRCGPRERDSRALLGYVPQDVRLHADQSVRETVQFYARLRRVGPERVSQLLADWGLAPFERRQVRHLSGGMRQKLALIVALLADPPVLLLDEPTSNLDAQTRREFADLLARLKTAGKTLLFCTHRPSEVWKLADRVVVLERGRKVADGPPDQVRNHLVEDANLCLIVPPDHAEAAADRLRAEGFRVERTGARLWVDAPAGRKLDAIDRLRTAGVPILDFDLESDRSSASNSPREAG